MLRCTDNSEQGLLSIMKETGVRDVVWTALYEPHLPERDGAIERALGRIGVRVHVEHSYLLHRPGQVSVDGVGAKGVANRTQGVR